MPIFKDLYIGMEKLRQNIKLACGHLEMQIVEVEETHLRYRDFIPKFIDIGEDLKMLTDKNNNAYIYRINSDTREYKEILNFEGEVKIVYLHENRLITNSAGVYCKDTLKLLQPDLPEQELMVACMRINRNQLLVFQMYYSALCLLEWQGDQYVMMDKRPLDRERYY